MGQLGHPLSPFTRQCELVMCVGLFIGLRFVEGSSSSNVAPPERQRKLLHLNDVDEIQSAGSIGTQGAEGITSDCHGLCVCVCVRARTHIGVIVWRRWRSLVSCVTCPCLLLLPLSCFLFRLSLIFDITDKLKLQSSCRFFHRPFR